MPKYAYSSRFILENVLYLGAKHLDALNLFETFFSRLVIFLIVWVHTPKILFLTQPAFKHMILREKTTDTVFIFKLFVYSFRLCWAHCVG